jgi:CubicO group peptidase (beta-lactamase class C family)
MNVQSAAKPTGSPQTPALPRAEPDSLGLSSRRLDAMSDALRREVDRGTVPGVTMLIGRRGRIGYFEAFGHQGPDAATARPMAHDSLFRIFSMTKPIVSIALMQLVENGRLVLTDPLAKFIPAFAETRVGVERHGQLELALPARPITIHDLLRHTAGFTYDFTGNSMVQRLYQRSGLRSRDLTNEAHAARLATIPLLCQPGAEWRYSRATDVLGRVIEVVSGQSLDAYLADHILAPLQMTETGFHAAAHDADRLAQPFPADPWTGDKVALFDPLEKPAMQSGGGGLMSTTMDYARFCQMLLNGGTLDGTRVIGARTLRFMASDHLDPGLPADPALLPPGYGFGLGFAVRRDDGFAPFAGTTGDYYWEGFANTFFWIDPREELFAVFMSQSPGQRDYFRALTRGLVYAALA